MSIHLGISQAVTADEWKKAYDDSLKIITALNLAELRKMSIHGTKVYCLTWSKEREDQKYHFKGWIGDGDYKYVTCCEENHLPSQLKEYSPDGTDLMLPYLIHESDYIFDYESDDRDEHYYRFWQGETQEQPQYMTLLCVGVMMQSRLKNKAFVYEGVTKEECCLAVKLVNDILDEKVELPEQCDLECLYRRVKELPLDEMDQIKAIDAIYLGEKNREFGIFMRSHFTQADLYQYWREQSDQYSLYGRLQLYREYLDQGYDLRELCRMINIEDDQIGEFVKIVINHEIYYKEKDRDTLVVRFKEARVTLREEVGDRGDIDALINRYLEEKKAYLEKTSNDSVCDHLEELEQRIKAYDISYLDDLILYKRGDILAPLIRESMRKLKKSYLQLLKDDHVKATFKLSFSKKRHLLAKNSFILCIRDCD